MVAAKASSIVFESQGEAEIHEGEEAQRKIECHSTRDQVLVPEARRFAGADVAIDAFADVGGNSIQLAKV
ncbi:trimethylguanosine synthase-like isoform X1 [Salvia divinorum]|uniref:Trimethylguanosine synthase-like isoform X1 n=1 Tax=Salvia divinorum TaxID=28513 RepID=A0ABD1HAG8_SALDI